MKYILGLLLFLSVITGTGAEAAIRALGGVDNNSRPQANKNKYTPDNNIGTTPVVNLKSNNRALICNKNGFTLKKCPAGYVPVFPCPQNNKFFQDCCPQQYRYQASYCIGKGLVPSSETCRGFHACLPKETESTE